MQKITPNERLRILFSTNKEGVVINQSVSEVNGYIFDFDGVLFKDCGVIAIGYAWLIRALRDGNYECEDIDFEESDIKQAIKFRSRIKGKMTHEKIYMLNASFGSSDSLPISLNELANFWAKVHILAVKEKFSENPRSALLPGAIDFITQAAQRGKVFGLTAFSQPVAEFLLEFVGLIGYFEKVLGNPNEDNGKSGKVDMLHFLFESVNTFALDYCYISDFVSDMNAGKAVNIVTVGIANSLRNGLLLLNKGCDLVATSTLAYKDILEILFAGKGT